MNTHTLYLFTKPRGTFSRFSEAETVEQSRTLLVFHRGRKSRYCLSLSRFLNICRPVLAERTSIILTFPAEIWEAEEERDKDEECNRRERGTAEQRDRKRERHISSHPHQTSRHAWMVTVWAEREERLGEGWGRVGSVGGGGMSPRGQPSSPLHLHP